MSPLMNPLMFREYDIRGVAERDLTDEVVHALGQGIGSLILDSGGARLVVGRDCRLHSPRLHAALVAGILASGADVLDIGVVPSPVLYFAVHTLDVQGGVEITGSHNPASDNGFKILCQKNSLDRVQLEALRARVEARDFRHGHGRLSTQSVVGEYLSFVQSRLQLGPRRFPVVVDAGNGTGGEVVLPLLAALGFPTLAVACEMDGRFPLHLPDPTVPENLRELQDAVRRSGAEVGIALDGDADRLTVIDSQGRILWGDQLMILFARAILAEQPGATFICEVKCSRAVIDEIERAGVQRVDQAGRVEGDELGDHTLAGRDRVGPAVGVGLAAERELVGAVERGVQVPLLARADVDRVREILKAAVQTFGQDHGLGARVDAGEIDEVWVYSFPGAGMMNVGRCRTLPRVDA